MPTLPSLAHPLTSAAGQVLRAGTRLIALRPAAKPLHPRGRLVTAVVRRTGSDARSGVPWLDDPGEDRAMVRFSRSVGLPDALPDVFGLALRVWVDGTHGDVLLSSTGLGRATRYVLTFARRPDGRPMTTLLPYRTPIGPVLIAATYLDAARLELSWAVGTSEWHPFAELVVGETVPTDGEEVSFDPVLNTVPGLEIYPWVRRLREPAYLSARRSRSTASS
jgi:hypothetical protein